MKGPPRPRLLSLHYLPCPVTIRFRPSLTPLLSPAASLSSSPSIPSAHSLPLPVLSEKCCAHNADTRERLER